MRVADAPTAQRTAILVARVFYPDTVSITVAICRCRVLKHDPIFCFFHKSHVRRRGKCIVATGNRCRVCQYMQAAAGVVGHVAIEAYTRHRVVANAAELGDNLRERIAVFVVARGELLRFHTRVCTVDPYRC